MYTIRHDVLINSSSEHVFNSITQADQLDKWWALHTTGIPALGEIYSLYFSPEYDWKAEVVKCNSPLLFELKFVESDEDWDHTKVSFDMIPKEEKTLLRFEHSGWQYANDHFRRTSFSWALYLKCLKDLVESDMTKPYNERT